MNVGQGAALTLELARDSYPVASALVVLAAIVLAVRLLSLLGPKSQPGALSLWHAALFTFFAYQTTLTVYWLPYLAAVAAVILMRGVDEALDDAGVEQIHPRRATTIDMVATAAVVAGLLHFSPDSPPPDEAEPRYPNAALDAARELELGPHVHNSAVYGSYVIWDGDFLVASDGRDAPVSSNQSAPEDSLERFLAAFDAQPADWVLADNSPGREQFRFLAGHPEWMAVHSGEEAVIYVPRSGNEHLADNEVRVRDPRNTMAGVGQALDEADAIHAIREELMTALGHSPRSLRVNAALARSYHHTGQRELMLRALATMDEIAPDTPDVRALRELLTR